MASKKLVNAPESCVEQMLRGVATALPGLDVHTSHRVLLRRQELGKSLGRVGLLSGGGSGHEPFCAGYVGQGMLSCAVAGSVFASPPASDVLYGIRCLAEQGATGILVVVANYTGDCLNFGLAAERAQALGLPVEVVTVGDDCALLEISSSNDPKSPSGQLAPTLSAVGRRGLCGLLFVYKLAGALATTGASLEAVATRAKEVAASIATIGVCLSPCSLPGAGPLFTLGAEEMELGLGVHGEQGAYRMQLCSARDATETMVARLVDALQLRNGCRVAALVNNLGGSSQLEQMLMAGELRQSLKCRGVRCERLFVGHLMTSLEMAGMQFSLLKLPPGSEGDVWLAALDEPTEAAGWPGGPLSLQNALPVTPAPSQLQKEHLAPGPAAGEAAAATTLRAVQAACAAAVGAEERLNMLDSGCGDGDCGSTLRRLAEEALQLCASGRLESSRPARLLQQLSEAAEARMGGTSGAVYSLLLAAGARAMAAEAAADACAWAAAWRSALLGLQRHTPARPGDRTLLDALEPACSAFEAASKGSWEAVVAAVASAAEAAEKGCEATRHMAARVGRASYVSPDRVQDVDAGAAGVAVWLRAVAHALDNQY